MNGQTAPSEVYTDGILCGWRSIFAYFCFAYHMMAMYLLYGADLREWDSQQFWSSTIILLRLPARDFLDKIVSGWVNGLYRAIELLFGLSSTPIGVRIGHSKGGIDLGRFSLNTVALFFLINSIFSACMVDRNMRRVIASVGTFSVWLIIDSDVSLSDKVCANFTQRAISVHVFIKGLFITAPKDASSVNKVQVRVGRVGISRGNGVGSANPSLKSASSDNSHAPHPLSRQCSKKIPFVTPPPSDSGVFLTLITGSGINGVDLALVSCFFPALAGTLYMPLHSDLACYVIFLCCICVLSLLSFVEKLLSQRTTLALSMASSHPIGDPSNETDTDRDYDNASSAAGSSSSLTNHASVSRGVHRAAYTEMHPDSPQFPPPALSTAQSASARNMLWADEGCRNMSDSPIVSLVLALATFLLLIQLMLLSLADPRRRLGSAFLSGFGVLFIMYTRKIILKR